MRMLTPERQRYPPGVIRVRTEERDSQAMNPLRIPSQYENIEGLIKCRTIQHPL